MGRAERVVDEDVREGTEFFGEGSFVLGLFRSVTGVLKEDDVSVLHGSNGCFGILADHIVVCGEGDRLAQELCEADCDGSEGQFGLRFALRFAEVGAKDDLATVSNEFLDGRKRGDQTVLVGDLAVFQGDVEVTAYEDFLAFYVDIVNGFLVEFHDDLIPS